MNEQAFCQAICTLVSKAGVSIDQIFKLRDPSVLHALYFLGQCNDGDFDAYSQQYFPWLQQQDAAPTPMSTQTRHLSRTSSVQSRPPSDCFSQSSRPSRGSTGTEFSAHSNIRQAAGQMYDSYNSNSSSLAPVHEGQSWLSVEEESGHPPPTPNSFYPSQVDDTFSNLHNGCAASGYPQSMKFNNLDIAASFANVPTLSSIPPSSTSLVNDSIFSSPSTHSMSPRRIAPAPKWSNIMPSQIESPAAKATSPTHVSDERKKIFCPIGDCSRKYCGRHELGKHIRADHEKCDKFTCQHAFCENTFKKDSDWKSHHTKSHSGCSPSSLADCRIHQELPRRKNWGCGFCVSHSHGLGDWLDHFINHVTNDHVQKSEFDFSVLMRSLLSNPAIKSHWQDYLVATGFANDGLFQWRKEAKETQVLLENLEWGVFHGESLSEPGKAEEVVVYAASLGQIVALPANAHAQQQFFEEFR